MRVVFIGNCQASALRALYDRYVQPYSDAETFSIASHHRLTAADRALIASADVLAVQSQDFAAKAGSIEFQADVPVHRFPVASGSFLWPFGGRERPGNKPAPGLPLGPFPAQMGDSYLNRLIREGKDVQQAAIDYLNLDVPSVVDLDRLLNIVLVKQKRMDDELGFQVSTIIADHFRTERLFRTSYHPETRIVVHLATTLFRHMGVDATILDRIERWQRHPGLPPPECPIHPSVARHFGLRYVDESSKYRLNNEGHYSFTEWVVRYLDGYCNHSLIEGVIHTAQNRPPAPTRTLLEDALTRSPGSGPGWGALATTLLRMDRLSEAIAAARRAAGFDPDSATLHAKLGELLAKSGDIEGAVQSYRTAWELDPAARSVRRRLPHLMMQAGDIAGAVRFVQAQIADPIEPPTSELLATLARLLERSGDRSEALRIARIAVSMSPPHLSALMALGDLLTAEGRHEEAGAILQQATELRPDASQPWYALGLNHRIRRDFHEARVAIDHAIQIDPDQPHYHGLRARILVQLQHLDDAEEACRHALRLRPADTSLLALRTDIARRIARRDQVAKAEPATS